jgi:methyl-accepting chemotaxis protein
VTRSREGAEVAGEVGKSLAAIVADVAKVTDLVEGISTASEEQAQGADQINTAVNQMDRVTQQNAASAEESASAAEQLSAQAETVNGMVAELVVLVGGSMDRRSSAAAPLTARPATGFDDLVPNAHPTKAVSEPAGAGSGDDLDF